MSDLYILSQDKKRILALSIALALVLFMTVVSVQSAWADHASTHHESQFEIVAVENEAAPSSSAGFASSCAAAGSVGTSGPGALEAACGQYSALLALYQDGSLEFHTPGR